MIPWPPSGRRAARSAVSVAGGPGRPINFLSGVVDPGRPPLVRIECEHYACLDSLCWSTSDGRHLIATDYAQHAPAGAGVPAALW